MGCSQLSCDLGKAHVLGCHGEVRGVCQQRKDSICLHENGMLLPEGMPGYLIGRDMVCSVELGSIEQVPEMVETFDRISVSWQASQRQQKKSFFSYTSGTVDMLLQATRTHYI